MEDLHFPHLSTVGGGDVVVIICSGGVIDVIT